MKTQFLYNTLMAMAITTTSFILLSLSCATLELQPKLKKKTEAIEMHCKKDKGAIIFTKDYEEKWFPTEIPPACRCFVTINNEEYVSTSTTGANFSKCKDSK